MKTGEIQQAIRTSEIGEKLAAMPRWSDFITEETPAEWVDFLGLTGIVLSHQEHFLEFTDPHLLNELHNGRFTPEEYEQLRRALAIHDIGEATVGDISSPLKNAATEKKEFLHALQNLQQLELPEENLAQLEQDYRQVVMGDNATLHYFFKAMEKIEYLDTAHRAFLSLQNGFQAEKGWLLVSEVLALSVPKALGYARQLPLSVGVFFVSLEKEFDQMFALSADKVDPKFAEQFAESRKLWEEFKPELQKNTDALVRPV